MTTKTVRNLRRRTRNHAIDALADVIALSKKDRETNHLQLRRIMLALREAVIVCREAWPMPEDVGIKPLGPGQFTTGN